MRVISFPYCIGEPVPAGFMTTHYITAIRDITSICFTLTSVALTQNTNPTGNTAENQM
jgi:hypothetical protein